MIAFRHTSFDIPCRVEVEHSDRFLCAHVVLADDIAINPGDRLCVHGEPIHISFGANCVFERTATVERAPLLVRFWTKLAAHLDLLELYEVSFSSRRMS